MQQLPRVCIIGAGSSGIAVAKAMKDRGIPYDCFEKGDRVGGNWYFRNPNSMSAAYESLHINTDCRLMEYRDYPMPGDTPDYPSHHVIMKYFEDYVDHFGLRDTITFNKGVEKADRRDDGVWEIRLDDGRTLEYDALLVANGHHWDPRWPEPAYPGEFAGRQIHSHAYLNPEEPVNCRGRKILVVGMGNSAMDIACELSRPGLADKVYLSARHGVWVVPKYIFGKPTTRLTGMPPWVPWKLNSWLTNLIVSLQVGKPWNYGLPRPDHRMLQAHPTISQEIYIRLGSGDVLPRPGIRCLDGDVVEFLDGRRDPVDRVEDDPAAQPVRIQGGQAALQLLDQIRLGHRLHRPQHPQIAALAGEHPRPQPDGIGKAGNPDTQPGVDIVIGPGTEAIAGEGKILTAGGFDAHIHWICPPD